jgi:hypothetical protein
MTRVSVQTGIAQATATSISSAHVLLMNIQLRTANELLNNPIAAR